MNAKTRNIKIEEPVTSAGEHARSTIISSFEDILKLLVREFIWWKICDGEKLVVRNLPSLPPNQPTLSRPPTIQKWAPKPIQASIFFLFSLTSWQVLPITEFMDKSFQSNSASTYKLYRNSNCFLCLFTLRVLYPNFPTGLYPLQVLGWGKDNHSSLAIQDTYQPEKV